MTNYVGPLDVPRTLDRLERRLGMDWIKSPYTRFEDVLAPDDPDLQIILKLRKKRKAAGQTIQGGDVLIVIPIV